MNQWIAIWNEDKSTFSQTFSNFKHMNCQNVEIFFTRDGRFINDQLFTCENGELLISDGVLLNLAELKEEYHVDNLNALCSQLIEEKGDLFFSSFVGPFSGVRVNKAGELFAWGNQTGDAPLFYYHGQNSTCVSNDFNLITRLMKDCGITYTLNEDAAFQIMSFGFLIDDGTMIKEVRRLQPGRYLHFDGETLKLERYHRFSFGRADWSFDECVQRIDQGFRAALKRCFDKDIEYGFQHMVDMSAGLDTRMVNWVAHDMGYGSVANFHYSQSDSDEFKFASAVSRRLGNDFHAYELDNISFIFDLDKIISMNYGLAVYCGITGGERMLSSINFNKYGLEHTGQLENISSYGNTDSHVPPAIDTESLRYSNLLRYPVPPEVANQYKNNEEFSYYCRGFQGILSTHMIRRNYSYAVAPFIDRDFFDICSNLPMEYKKDHKLYWAWIDRYYPEAGKMASSQLRKQSTYSYFVFRIKRKLENYIRNISKRLGIASSANTKNNMNPFDYWYDTLPEMRNFIANYYHEVRPFLKAYPQTAQAVDKMYASERVMDKMLALTVLGAVKAFFGDNSLC